MTGSDRGRKPRLVDTMKAGREVSFGSVSRRTLKETGASTDPMVRDCYQSLV